MHWRSRYHRRQSINEPGHAHELTFTCYRRFKFLAAERTCEWLATSIDEARNKLDFALWAYVFMPDHVHVVVFPKRDDHDMGSILRAIKEPTARKAIKHLETHSPEWLPRITVERGVRVERRFWQAGGGYDRNIVEPETLYAMVDYIHNNPVRRALASCPTDWKWSSAQWFEGAGQNSLAPDPIDPTLLKIL